MIITAIYLSFWITFTYNQSALLPTFVLGATALLMRREAIGDVPRYVAPALLLSCAAFVSAYLYGYHFSDYMSASFLLGKEQGLTFLRGLAALCAQVFVFLAADQIASRLSP